MATQMDVDTEIDRSLANVKSEVPEPATGEALFIPIYSYSI